MINSKLGFESNWESLGSKKIQSQGRIVMGSRDHCNHSFLPSSLSVLPTYGVTAGLADYLPTHLYVNEKTGPVAVQVIAIRGRSAHILFIKLTELRGILDRHGGGEVNLRISCESY